MTSEEMKSAMFYNKFVVFDTESTGFQPNNIYSKIIEIGAVKVIDGRVVDRFDEFINPGIKIPKKISELTGITDDMVQDKDGVHTVLKRFKEWIGEDFVLVGHNISHDLRFVNFFGNQCGITFDEPNIDTQVLAKSILHDGTWNKINSRIKENYKLTSLAILFNVADSNHHRADNDAEVTWKVLQNLQKTERKKNPNAIYSQWQYPKTSKQVEEKEITVVNASPWDKGERLYVTLSQVNGDEKNFTYIFYDFKRNNWGIKSSTFPVPFDKIESLLSGIYQSKFTSYDNFRVRKTINIRI